MKMYGLTDFHGYRMLLFLRGWNAWWMKEMKWFSCDLIASRESRPYGFVYKWRFVLGLFKNRIELHVGKLLKNPSDPPTCSKRGG